MSCHLCGKSFEYPSYLKRHLERTHRLVLDSSEYKPQRPKDYTCALCSTSFTLKHNLYRHLRKHFPGQSVEFITKPFSCDICCKAFSQLKYLNKHLNDIHEQKPEGKRLAPGFMCPECKEMCSSHAKLDRHLENMHDFTVDKEERYFENMEEFTAFKRELEEKQQSSFVVRTSSLKSSVYVCNRSRLYPVKKSASTQKVKWQENSKIEGNCPARIVLRRCSNGKYKLKATLQKTHMGHECSVQYQRLSDSDKTKIAAKIGAGFSLGRILDDVRESMTTDSDLKRFHLLNKDDLRNISRQYNLSYYKTNTVIDLVNPSRPKGNKKSPVLFHKRLGEKHDSGILDEDDFVLVILNPYQKMMEPSSIKVIMVDSSCGTRKNTYNFQVTRVLTHYDRGAEYPLAICISNRVDSAVMTVFFSSITKSVGLFSPDVFMSDDATVYWYVWSEVVNTPEYRPLNEWQVDKDWKVHLNRVIHRFTTEEIQSGHTKVVKAVASLLVKRSINAIKNVPTHRMLKFAKSHRESVKIPLEAVHQVSESEWVINSKEQSSYSVVKVETSCIGCILICRECQVCVHQFICTCQDLLVKSNMCIHVHACVRSSKLNRQFVKATDSTSTDKQEVSDGLGTYFSCAGTLQHLEVVTEEGTTQLVPNEGAEVDEAPNVSQRTSQDFITLNTSDGTQIDSEELTEGVASNVEDSLEFIAYPGADTLRDSKEMPEGATSKVVTLLDFTKVTNVTNARSRAPNDISEFFTLDDETVLYSEVLADEDISTADNVLYSPAATKAKITHSERGKAPNDTAKFYALDDTLLYSEVVSDAAVVDSEVSVTSNVDTLQDSEEVAVETNSDIDNLLYSEVVSNEVVIDSEVMVTSNVDTVLDSEVAGYGATSSMETEAEYTPHLEQRASYASASTPLDSIATGTASMDLEASETIKIIKDDIVQLVRLKMADMPYDDLIQWQSDLASELSEKSLKRCVSDCSEQSFLSHQQNVPKRARLPGVNTTKKIVVVKRPFSKPVYDFLTVRTGVGPNTDRDE